MSSAAKRLLHASAVFALASGLQKGAQLLIIPLITKHLGPEALKVYDVALVYAVLFAMLGVLGQDVAASVHYFDAGKSEGQRARVLSSGLYIQAVSTALLLGALTVLHRPIGAVIFGGDAATMHGWALTLWSMPGTVAVNYALNILRWKERGSAYLALCVLQVVSTLLPAVYFVLQTGEGVDAVLWSYVGGTTLAGAVGLWLVRREISGRGAWRWPAWSTVRPLISYGVVFGGATFFFGLLPAMDRSFLLRFGLGDALPEYALAVKIGAVPGLLITAVGLSVGTHAFRIWHRATAAEEIHRLARATLIIFLMGVPVMMVGKDWLVNLFANGAQYPETTRLLPFFFFGWVADGALYFAMLGLYKSKRALPPLIVLAASAGLAALLNIFLIPALGVAGAGLAFALAKCAQVVLSWAWSNRYWRIEVPAWPLAVALTVSLVLSGCAYYLPTGWYALLVLTTTTGASLWMKRAGMLDVLMHLRSDEKSVEEEKVAATELSSLHHEA